MSELGKLVREVRALRDRLRREPGVKFLDLKLVGMSGRELELATLVVSQQRRTRGVGTRVMQAITAFCDEHGLWLSLVPSDVYGSDYDRLVGFYRRHGLEPVPGTHGMQRPPRRQNPDERQRRLERAAALGDRDAAAAASRGRVRAPSRAPEPITLGALVSTALRDHEVADVESAIQDWLGAIPDGSHDRGLEVHVRRGVGAGLTLNVALESQWSPDRIRDVVAGYRLVGRWRQADVEDAVQWYRFDVDLARTLVNYQDALAIMRRLRDTA